MDKNITNLSCNNICLSYTEILAIYITDCFIGELETQCTLGNATESSKKRYIMLTDLTRVSHPCQHLYKMFIVFISNQYMHVGNMITINAPD